MVAVPSGQLAEVSRVGGVAVIKLGSFLGGVGEVVSGLVGRRRVVLLSLRGLASIRR